MNSVTITLKSLLFLWLALAALSLQAEDRHRRERSSLKVSPSSVSMSAGSSAVLTISGAYGSLSAESGETSLVEVSVADDLVTLTAIKTGSTTVTVRDRKNSREIPVTVVNSAPPPLTQGGYSLLAWNDLGMHCVDGKDYSVFSILPPYNNLIAQLVDNNGGQVSEGVELTYQAVEDTHGSINTYSAGKTNFWDYVLALFGANPAPDYGLNLNGDPGNPTPGLTPEPMQYNAERGWFQAEGLPITPIDDNSTKNFYPMVEVVAKDLDGNVLATTQTVLPVSDEMTCKACHSSFSGDAAKPADGWLNDADAEKDWKRNILKLHDEKQLATSLYQDALVNFGYLSTGLLATADSGQPVLCASCHGSNALQSPGFSDIKPLTQALHGSHATVTDPNTLMTLDDSSNRESCYLCHPGQKTQCLRGAMGNAQDSNGDPAMSCQSCHGSMSQVGSSDRDGWLDEPTCQSCHHDGQREIVGIDAQGLPLQWTDETFASNPDTPIAGKNLYRFSSGHGDLQCEACHGATHAIYPSHEANDNVQSIALQGHAGTVNECSACHTDVPLTAEGGPHGLHTIGAAWIEEHEDVAEHNGAESCSYCHGADYRGSPLSALKTEKIFRVEEETKTFAAGHQIGCYDCHDGPNP
ncbi:hypothetical protein [Methylomarinum vadi]|uniref:hypothetical protein n=1 Tax=Methylomarinum vadi TaxID=438855 RepID=UPI00055DD444|nr:hypothetical protein [Methylomarinum vadi]